MGKRLKLMADYDCWPLWDLDSPGNVDPATLNLSEQLQSDLTAWSATYNNILNRDSGKASFSSEEHELTFNQKGYNLLAALKRELPDKEISYFDHRTNMLVDTD